MEHLVDRELFTIWAKLNDNDEQPKRLVDGPIFTFYKYL